MLLKPLLFMTAILLPAITSTTTRATIAFKSTAGHHTFAFRSLSSRSRKSRQFCFLNKEKHLLRRSMHTTGSTTSTFAQHSLDGKMLVSVEDAIKYHPDTNVKFVDGSWFLQGRNGRDEYEAGPRIASSIYFDIDDIASPPGSQGNPNHICHMMPTVQLFEAAMDAMGIDNANHLIVYGTRGCMCTQRTWFQLRAMGHDKDKVHLMQGSLDDWMALGGPVDAQPTKAVVAKELDLTRSASYVAANEPRNVVGLEEMKDIVGAASAAGVGDSSGNEATASDAIVIDVRSRDRFLGQVDEPRPGLRLGHMPGAINVPFTDMLRPDMTYKSESEMKSIFETAGIDVDTDKRIVASCGTGVTACVVAGALEVCGRDPAGTYIYDGSWMEWGGQKDTPIVTEE